MALIFKSPYATPVLGLISFSAVLRLGAELDSNPKDSFKIIQLKFSQHKTYQEIADETGLTISNVGYKLHHIIKGLSDELKEEGFFNE